MRISCSHFIFCFLVPLCLHWFFSFVFLSVFVWWYFSPTISSFFSFCFLSCVSHFWVFCVWLPLSKRKFHITVGLFLLNTFYVYPLCKLILLPFMFTPPFMFFLPQIIPVCAVRLLLILFVVLWPFVLCLR